MKSNTKRRILDGALELLRAEEGATITLEAAAKQVGLSKPGLMYHFPTKEALVLAVVDHVAGRWEALLLDRLGQAPEAASPHQRIRAYVEVALSEQFDRADFAVFSNALYRQALTETWVGRLDPWLTLPDSLPGPARARLTAARLLADAYWAAAATGVFPVPDRDRGELLAVAETLLKDEASR
ncbi:MULTISPECIES: TetR/AcrR family transcriptional regulator [Streptomyces]|uniref:TetR/AcrR family transcriptional regulator n=1 Tax=Streptomyces ramulosus TaxID=47762 RepID=A0ABW1FCT6_9ACTN